MTTSATEVRFGRLERRGLLIGLTGAQLALLGTALVVVVGAGLAAGPVGVALASPAWCAAAAWALVPIGGRPLVEVSPVAVSWAARRLTGRREVLARPHRQDTDSLVIPGAGRLHIGSVGEIATIRCGRVAGGPVTVVAEVRGSGFLLEGAAVQDRRVSAWGRLLGSLSQLPEIGDVQVLHRAVPSSGEEIRRWWTTHAGARSSWPGRVVEDLVTETTGSMRLQSLVALTLSPRRGADLATVLGSVGESLDVAELELAGWLTTRQIGHLLREAYDPACALSAGAGTVSPRGSMGIAEQWSYARSDSAFHVTYWISEWPRSATHPGFLRPLLLGPGTQRTFTLLARPLPAGKALREIRRARAEQLADAATRARIGRVEDEATRAAAAELTRREEDLVAGHGDLRFLGLLSVTAATLDDLADACAATETAAAQAGCELRRLVGQQVQAYAAAALPLARGLS
jgi:hypothetical protein